MDWNYTTCLLTDTFEVKFIFLRIYSLFSQSVIDPSNFTDGLSLGSLNFVLPEKYKIHWVWFIVEGIDLFSLFHCLDSIKRIDKEIDGLNMEVGKDRVVELESLHDCSHVFGFNHRFDYRCSFFSFHVLPPILIPIYDLLDIWKVNAWSCLDTLVYFIQCQVYKLIRRCSFRATTFWGMEYSNGMMVGLLPKKVVF